uniref:Large ribosomal subunit protein uL23c n=1 Tax=Kuetzingia canaliculata TaxID=228262 RepID=A0A1Z1MQ97_KUECA|nr:ribosomal protein L23 [Kuetzingia canaliculata]ARW67914.1 ribosomal protein L23 [Kuetzingia canaliculata]
MNQKITQNIDLIKYPIITDKTTKNIENNIYYFTVNKKSDKNEIKKAIEYIFNVKVKKVNTLNCPPKKKTIGKTKGNLTNYKKAIIKLKDTYRIKLFEDN